METALERVIARHRASVTAAAPVVVTPEQVSPDGQAQDDVTAAIAELAAKIDELDQRVTTLEGAAVEDAMMGLAETAPDAMPAAVTAATKSEGDAGNFGPGDYAYVPDPASPSTWKLRLTATPSGDPDSQLVGAAAAALSPTGYRGNPVDIPEADLPAVRDKVRAAWHAANPDRPDSELPDSLKS